MFFYEIERGILRAEAHNASKMKAGGMSMNFFI